MAPVLLWPLTLPSLQSTFTSRQKTEELAGERFWPSGATEEPGAMVTCPAPARSPASCREERLDP